MNKRTFVLEINREGVDCGLTLESILESYLTDETEQKSNHPPFVLVREINVEQNVERPQNKTIELLEKAESILSDSETHYHRCFSRDIEKHLEEIRRKEE